MHFTNPTALVAAAAFLLPSFTSGHMIMVTPTPFNNATIDNSPLSSSGSNFPCKSTGSAGFYDATGIDNTMAVGAPQTLSFRGSAVHGGGSCQLALTTDQAPTPSTKWQVVLSIEGGCPTTDDSGPSTYQYTIPDSIAPGKYVFAWTWISKLAGQPEYYMNCAPITVTAGSKKRSASLLDSGLQQRADSSLPDLFVSNLESINSCKTTPGTDPIYPDPGPTVQKPSGASRNYASPAGSNCVPLGATDSSSGGSASGSSSGASSGPSGVGGSPVSSATSTAPSSTALAATASASSPGTGTSASSYIGSSSSSSSTFGSASSPGSLSGTIITLSTPMTSASTGGNAVTTTLTPVNTQSVGSGSSPTATAAPTATSAAAAAPVGETSMTSSASAAATVTTIAPVSASAGSSGSGNGPAASAAMSTPVSNLSSTIATTVSATPIASSAAMPSATSAPSASSGSSSASGTAGSGSASGSSTGTASGGQSGPCSSEGAWNCVGGTSFQRCASGVWSPLQAVAPGTTCVPGQSSSYNVARRGVAAAAGGGGAAAAGSIRFSSEHLMRRRRAVGGW